MTELEAKLNRVTIQRRTINNRPGLAPIGSSTPVAVEETLTAMEPLPTPPIATITMTNAPSAAAKGGATAMKTEKEGDSASKNRRLISYPGRQDSSPAARPRVLGAPTAGGIRPEPGGCHLACRAVTDEARDRV
ncbi:unnamed protein product [Linum trigynum]